MSTKTLTKSNVQTTGIRFKPDLKERIDEVASKNDISINAAVNLLIDYAFIEMKKSGVEPKVRIVSTKL